jgi:hypothetical protein
MYRRRAARSAVQEDLSVKPVHLLFSTLLLGSVLVVASCGDPSPVGVGPSRPDIEAGKSKPVASALIVCRALRADAVTQLIGPEGGELNVGPHTLDIPPGALSDTVSITAVAPSDTLRLIRFKPEGLVFQQPASLSMSYKNCRIPAGTYPRIAYLSDAMSVVVYMPSSIDQWAQWVITDLPHFSNYAVAW